jgi:hypothetical protein
MMMTTNNTSGTFGIIPSSNNPAFGQVRQPLVVPRKATTTLDAPNAFTGRPDGQITVAQIPAAFGGTGGGNTMLAAQIQTSVAPRQTAFGATPTQYKFGANTTAESYVAEKGSANVARDSALASGGASGDVVTKAGATYTG